MDGNPPWPFWLKSRVLGSVSARLVARLQHAMSRAGCGEQLCVARARMAAALAVAGRKLWRRDDITEADKVILDLVSEALHRLSLNLKPKDQVTPAVVLDAALPRVRDQVRLLVNVAARLPAGEGGDVGGSFKTVSKNAKIFVPEAPMRQVACAATTLDAPPLDAPSLDGLKKLTDKLEAVETSLAAMEAAAAARPVVPPAFSQVRAPLLPVAEVDDDDASSLSDLDESDYAVLRAAGVTARSAMEAAAMPVAPPVVTQADYDDAVGYDDEFGYFDYGYSSDDNG